MMYNPYLRYVYKLNGDKISAINIGTNATDKAEEAFDEGSFNLPISVKDIEYEMYGTLEIEAYDSRNNYNKFTYLIIHDEVIKSSVVGWYEHQIRVVEYTDKLNQYFIDTFVNTLPNQFNLNKRAQFEVHQESELLYVEFGISMQKVKYLPILDIRDTYYTGNLTFEQVDKAEFWFKLEENWYYLDVYIQLDDGTKENLSNDDVTFNLTTGYHKITYGLLQVPSVEPHTFEDLPIYTFYINVIPNYELTLFDVIQRLKNIKPFETQRYHSITRIFDIDISTEINGYTLREVLEKTKAPQLFIQHATMFQVLSGIFKYINSIPRLLHSWDFVDTLSRDDFNEVLGQYNVFGAFEYTSNQDVQLYATRGISPLQRVLPSNLDKPNMETPANNFFQTVRASDVQLTDNDGQFVLPLPKGKPIYKITKFEVLLPQIKVSSTGTFEPEETVVYDDFILDLTDVLIDLREWKIKNNVDVWSAVHKDVFQNNIGLLERKIDSLFWEQGKDYIDFSKTFEGVITKVDLITTVIKTQINKLFSYVMKNEIPFNNSIDVSSVSVSYGSLEYNELKFNLEYITLNDFNIVQNREDTSIINRYSEISLKQSDKQLNVEHASRKSYGELQRGALPNYSFTKLHYYLDEMIPLFSIDDEGYVITQRSILFYNTYLKVTYNATKDHNRLQEFIGVNQEYRPFEIPTSNKIYDRKEIYNDIIFIKPHDLILIASSNLIAPKFYEQLVANLQNNKTYKKATFALVWTDGFHDTNNINPAIDMKFIITPISIQGVKQTIMMSVGFDDNQVVGDIIEEIEGNKYNKAILYTDNIARLEDVWFATFDNIEDIEVALDPSDYDYETYPLTTGFALNDTKLEEILDNSLMNNGMLFSFESSTHGIYNPFKYYKDSSENMTIQYGVSIQSFNYGQFIVGQRFTSNNPLVNNDLDNLYIYTYDNDTFYGIFNDQLIKNMGSAVKTLLTSDNVTLTPYSRGANNHGITVKIDSSLLSGKTSWAIGDDEGNLYLACNEPIDEFDFEGVHMDYRVTEIGKRPFTVYEIVFTSSANLGFELYAEVESAFEISLNTSATIGMELQHMIQPNEVINLNSSPTLGFELEFVTQDIFTQNFSSSVTLGFEISYETLEYYETLNSNATLGFEITYTTITERTAVPTVGYPYCLLIGGGRNILSDITNNDTEPVGIYSEGLLLDTIGGGQTKTVTLGNAVVSLSFSYNVSAKADDKLMSNSVTVGGTLLVCLLP